MGSYPPQRYVTRGTKLYHNMFQVASSGGGGGGVSGWKELARTTLGTYSSNISVSSLPEKRYYMVLYGSIAKSTGGSDSSWRFNSDSSANYAVRREVNGSTDSTMTNQSRIYNEESGGGRFGFGMAYVANKSDLEKLMIIQNAYGDAGATGWISRKRITGKWTNTSDSIDEITFHYYAGRAEATSEVVVLGYDPDDSHTDGTWQELASVQLDSAGDNLSSGSFESKKYLWVQAFMEQTDNTITGNITFNGDTNSNYSRRRSNNDGSDSGAESETSIDVRGGESKNRFDNIFIANRSDKEKIVIGNMVVAGQVGSGTSPDRTEYVAKWANTSSQINEINFNNIDAGSYGTNSIIKVWGFD